MFLNKVFGTLAKWPCRNNEVLRYPCRVSLFATSVLVLTCLFAPPLHFVRNIAKTGPEMELSIKISDTLSTSMYSKYYYNGQSDFTVCDM